MKDTRVKKSIDSKFVPVALWFGTSTALIAAFIITIWSQTFSSLSEAGSLIPALFWSFLSGALISGWIWRTPTAHASLYSSYPIAALQGALVVPVSLLVALVWSVLVGLVIGGPQSIEDILQALGIITFLVISSMGIHILLLSALSGIGYAFIWKRKNQKNSRS